MVMTSQFQRTKISRWIRVIQGLKCDLKFRVLLSSVALLCCNIRSVAAIDEPYFPTADSEILETLPTSFLTSRNELAAARKRLAENPDNQPLAAAVAEQLIAAGNQESDPRFYGYARAAINRWWESDDADSFVIQARAKLKEKDHLYEAAVADLKIVVGRSPQEAQVLLQLANIYRVLGRYEEATAIADQMSAFAGDVPAALCRAPIMAATGQAEAAYDLLTEIKPTAIQKFPGTLSWIKTVQAEIAEALGRDDEVEQHYLAGLKEDPSDYRLLHGYSDFLLDRQRYLEVYILVREQTNDTGALLCGAIAAKHLGYESLREKLQSELATRFDEIRLRGSEPHLRFEARYALVLQNDPEHALELALANWEQQKEVRDARNVLEAALALKNPAAAHSVLSFLQQHKTEHVVLSRLIAELESL